MTTRETSETTIMPAGERALDTELRREAQAQRDAWAPSTLRTYRTAWKTFASWCEVEGAPAQPAAPYDVARVPGAPGRRGGTRLATARTYLAAVSASHRLGGHPDPAVQTIVRATLKRLGREYGKPQRQAKPLTAEALAAVRGHRCAAAGGAGSHRKPLRGAPWWTWPCSR